MFPVFSSWPPLSPSGAPEEFDSWQRILARHPDGGLTDWPGTGKFTDDTQMALALARSLVGTAGLVPFHEAPSQVPCVSFHRRAESCTIMRLPVKVFASVAWNACPA